MLQVAIGYTKSKMKQNNYCTKPKKTKVIKQVSFKSSLTSMPQGDLKEEYEDNDQLLPGQLKENFL